MVHMPSERGLRATCGARALGSPPRLAQEFQFLKHEDNWMIVDQSFPLCPVNHFPKTLPRKFQGLLQAICQDSNTDSKANTNKTLKYNPGLQQRFIVLFWQLNFYISCHTLLPCCFHYSQVFVIVQNIQQPTFKIHNYHPSQILLLP